MSAPIAPIEFLHQAGETFANWQARVRDLGYQSFRAALIPI